MADRKIQLGPGQLSTEKKMTYFAQTVQDEINELYKIGITPLENVGGSSTNITANAVPAIEDYYQVGIVLLKFKYNIGSPPQTLNIDGLGAIPLKNSYGDNISAGEYTAGSIVQLKLENGSEFRVISTGPMGPPGPPGPATNLNPVDGDVVGVNMTANDTNRLSVASQGVILSYDNTSGSGSSKVKINKSTPGDDAIIIFQTAWSSRAVIGTDGDNNFHVKVSADDVNWYEAFWIDRFTGDFNLPEGRIGGKPTRSYYWGASAMKFGGGNYSTAIGGATMYTGGGVYSIALGHTSMYLTGGNYATAAGIYSMRNSGGNKCSAFGYNSFNAWKFKYNKDITAVDYQNKLFTVPGHGIPQDLTVACKIQGSDPPAPLWNNTLYSFKAIDADTLKFVGYQTLTDSGSNSTLDIGEWYYGSTAIGADAMPTMGNQVMLGDASLKQVRTYGCMRVGSYTIGTLPSASEMGGGAIIYISDESGGPVIAFSDGTNWRRVTDREIVS